MCCLFQTYLKQYSIIQITFILHLSEIIYYVLFSSIPLQRNIIAIILHYCLTSFLMLFKTAFIKLPRIQFILTHKLKKWNFFFFHFLFYLILIQQCRRQFHFLTIYYHRQLIHFTIVVGDTFGILVIFIDLCNSFYWVYAEWLFVEYF